jgi:arylsulfatase A-like enzyme
MDLIEPGKREDLVNLMDIAATTLGLAGVEVPEFMDAKDVFAEDFHREYIYASADRWGNVIDRTRSVMGERFHYIRNFLLDRPLFNWGAYEMVAFSRDPEGKTTSLMAMRRMAEAGELEGAQMAPYGKRVAEELYDLKSDPDEVNNLAADPAYREQLTRMRKWPSVSAPSSPKSAASGAPPTPRESMTRRNARAILVAPPNPCVR